MKNKFLLFPLFICLFLLSHFQAISQECGFGALFQQQLQQNPNLLNELAQSGNTVSNLATQDEYIIPVVVHVIHSGGPENISDAQIFRALEILNQGFQGDFDPAGLDTKIRFRLAEIDPYGCTTDGIVRVFQNTAPCILTGSYTPKPGIPVSSLSYWPKSRYFNIWVISCFDNANYAAFANLPSTGNPSNGIVILNQYFGDIGTAFPNYALFKTIVHEAGHAFGLLHIWGPEFLMDTPTWYRCYNELEGDTQGDFVEDTPPQDIVYYYCDQPENSCHNENPDVNDNTDNFMAYGHNYCLSKSFTQGQNNKFIQPRLLDAYNTLWSPLGLECAGLTPASFPTEVEIDQNTTWTTSNLPNNGIINMDKIVVKSGVVFTIDAGVEIHFRRCNQTSNFVIEPNARVILEGKLSNNLCNPSDYWSGVEVAGTNGLYSQLIPGEIVVGNGAVIEAAQFGIRNKATINGIEYAGGKISAYGATFRNNNIGVRFYTYLNIDKPAPGPWTIPDDGAEFIDCTFTVDGSGVPRGASGKLQAHMYIEGVKGIKINSSVFRNHYVNIGFKGRGIGIYAVDGGFDVNGDGDLNTLEFSSLQYGIQTISAGNNQAFTVKKCAFDNIAVGIFDRGVSNATITFNDFAYFHSFSTGTYVADQIGIYLEGTMSFIDIQENQFHDEHNGDGDPLNTIGICSNSLGAFDNIIRRNYFESVTVSNVANGSNSGNNTGLRYLCNTSLYLTGYDIALTEGASIRSVQEGPPSNPGPNQQPTGAGNKFSYFNDAFDDDDVISAGAPFTYRYRTPLNTFEEPIETTFGKVTKIITPSQNPCGPVHQQEPPPRLEWEANFNSEKSSWFAAKQIFLTALDGGNTAALVNTIENTVNTASIINTLSTLSPWVSEQAFRTLLTKHPAVSAIAIKTLLLQNPDVLNDGVFWVLLENSGVFSIGDLQTLENTKGSATLRTPIQQSMAIHKAEMDYWGALYLNDFLHETPNYSSSFYQTLLQDFGDYHADALIVEELLRNGSFIQALNLIDNMETKYCVTTAELAQHGQYKQVIQVMLGAFLDNRSMYQLNTAEIAQMEAISLNSSGLPKVLSTNLLQGNGEKILSFAPCALPSTLALRAVNNERTEKPVPAMKTANNAGAIRCYPNPAGDFVQFDLSSFPADLRCGQLTIFDMMGNIISQKALENAPENIIVDTRNVPNGIYLYRVSCIQEKTFSGKFIVAKP